VPVEVISQVSNYPNPVDFRKEKKTYITYVLNEDAEVTVSLYDLMGYKVYEWNMKPSDGSHQGEESWVNGTGKGAMAGTNVIVWDGQNQSGNPVSKGGYVAQIVVKSGKGIIKTTRKIGVIR
jgi:flagellar hook assembly protein FlgD